MSKEKAYFAHSTSDFNTDFEREVLEALEHRFGFEVINPNCAEGQASYKTGGLAWFHEQAEKCDICIVLPLPTGAIGSGVAATADKFFRRRAPVHVLEINDGIAILRQVSALEHRISSKLTGEATRILATMPNGGR